MAWGLADFDPLDERSKLIRELSEIQVRIIAFPPNVSAPASPSQRPRMVVERARNRGAKFVRRRICADEHAI
jgi:hypothetical protein